MLSALELTKLTWDFAPAAAGPALHRTRCSGASGSSQHLEGRHSVRHICSGPPSVYSSLLFITIMFSFLHALQNMTIHILQPCRFYRAHLYRQTPVIYIYRKMYMHLQNFWFASLFLYSFVHFLKEILFKVTPVCSFTYCISVVAGKNCVSRNMQEASLVKHQVLATLFTSHSHATPTLCFKPLQLMENPFELWFCSK